MWHKYSNIGVWIWMPEKYVFRESLAFFTMQNNILDENKQIRHYGLDILKDRATIVVYENYASAELIDIFNKYVVGHQELDNNGANEKHNAAADGYKSINATCGNGADGNALQNNDGKFANDKQVQNGEDINQLVSPFKDNRKYLYTIGIFSFKRNRYSKPFTGAMELLKQISNMSAFRLDWSIMVSPHIGIGGKYADRAFAHNIGINTVITPAVYFKLTTNKISWNWPASVLTEYQKKKLFLFDGEPRFSQFLTAGQNLVIVIGPPSSGKTILGRRIAQFIGSCIVCKNELPPPKSFGKKSIVHISRAPTLREKEQLLKWLTDSANGTRQKNTDTTSVPINLVWLEMNVSRPLAEFLRNLRVQISRQSCPVIQPYAEIKQYYKLVEPIDPDKIMSPIVAIRFPLILKRIAELNYIY